MKARNDVIANDLEGTRKVDQVGPDQVAVGLAGDEDLKDVADGVGGEDGVVDGDGSSADVRESTS